MTLDFHLPACRSLKEKRSRLRGLKDRFGKDPGIAMYECGSHDLPTQARWCVVAAANDQAVVRARLRAIEDYIIENADAYLVDSRLEILR